LIQFPTGFIENVGVNVSSTITIYDD